jgi:hypothetical protein
MCAGVPVQAHLQGAAIVPGGLHPPRGHLPTAHVPSAKRVRRNGRCQEIFSLLFFNLIAALGYLIASNFVASLSENLFQRFCSTNLYQIPLNIMPGL